MNRSIDNREFIKALTIANRERLKRIAGQDYRIYQEDLLKPPVNIPKES
jgi:hypothetical protein